MENSLKKIFLNMPVGTKLYSPICGECKFEGLDDDIWVSIINERGVPVRFHFDLESDRLDLDFGFLWKEKYEIFKCTIPKGTKVYYGEYCVATNCYPAIAAKQIIFNEMV